MAYFNAYYRKVFHLAFVNTAKAVGLSKTSEIVRALFLWSSTVLILFELNLSRLAVIGTDRSQVSGEVRLGLAALMATVALFLTIFLLQLFVAPARLHQENKNIIAELETSIQSEAQAEKCLLQLNSLRALGFSIYNSDFDALNDEEYFAWRQSMEEWAEQVRSELRESWSVAALIEFDDPGSYGGWTKLMKNRDRVGQIEKREQWLLPRYSSYFKNLEDLVKYGTPKCIGDRVVSLAKV